MDTRLKQIFSNDLPFGGLHVVAFGDFHQCPPIKDIALWKSDVPKNDPDNAAGRLIWTTFFSGVVELEEIMRQRDEKNWAEFLRRMRSNTCTLEDGAFISSIASRSADLRDPRWRSAVILTATNKVQQLLSLRCAERDARAAKVKLVQWQAVYKRKKAATQATKSMAKDKGQNCGPHLFAYAPKMPVMLLSNKIGDVNSVPFGLANGTMGFLVGLVLDPDEPPADEASPADVHTLSHVPKGAFVYVPGLQITPWPNLPDDVIALCDQHVESVVYLKACASRLEGKANKSVSRYQLPLLPAYALTIHKSQGLSIGNCIVDCDTRLFGLAHNMAYVALSRVTSSQGLAFFGNLKQDKWISNAPPPDLLAEEARLQSLKLTT